METNPIDKRFEIFTKNISAAFLALCNALEKKGAIGRAEIQAALQERLVRMTVDQNEPEAELVILKSLALNLGNAAPD